MKRSFKWAGALGLAVAPLGSCAAQEEGGEKRPARALFEELDADRDGAISPEEWKGFFRRLDQDGDGKLSPRELRRLVLGEPEPPARPGPPEGRSPATLRAAEALRKAQRSEALPRPGDLAPDFSLKLLPGSRPPDLVKPDGEGRVRLSDHRGKQPVVLIFGSYT